MSLYKNYLEQVTTEAAKYRKNKEDFIGFLRGTLIPDLRRSGMTETAKDFQDAIKWMSGKKGGHKSAEDFVKYLTGTLIPDLKESGRDATAEDFEEAVYWIKKG